MIFYNNQGNPVAYCEDEERIYLFSGQIVGYFYKDAIYAYNGYQLGWFGDGWVRDLKGNCVFFTDKSHGGMARPARSPIPARGARSPIPPRSPIEPMRARPALRLSWSELSNEKFFMQ